ncbi:hypothetical protein KGM_200919 [Danaus plexippus plexippus]|uniref:Uncharacterized protein n=1 Tax=Danaus plexippus plexippus TaxID=278856 RepID=A0A212F497_DANPL|nr:hypothetical protein KGM_200919 [Danaus plexippus plexippus]
MMLFKWTCCGVLIFLINISGRQCNVQIGPDPWDYVSPITFDTNNNAEIPPDLRTAPPKKVQTNNLATGEWFYKRILAFVLKGGQIKKNEDGSVEVSLQMRYNTEHWKVLNEYVLPSKALSEDMYRRSMGYIEEAIYKPTITEKIVMAWHEHIQLYITEYKTEITWLFSIMAGVGTIVWLWNHMSHKHLIFVVVIGLYLYEVFTSYKEAEKQEMEKFMQAINTCKWYIWTSECEVPPPDPLIFIKHMNPLKIGVRMFTTLLSEPMLCISETTKVMIHGVTDGLWYPFDKIMYGVLMISFNLTLVLLLVMILFNFVLNIPFNLSFGLVKIALKQRDRSTPIMRHQESPPVQAVEIGDRISGENLNKLLDICSRSQLAQKKHKETLAITCDPKIKRSASTGRLPSLAAYDGNQNKL